MSKVVGTLHNRWILDGFFVETTRLWKSDGKESRSLEIVGYDPSRKAHASHIFRPNGAVEAANVSLDGKTDRARPRVAIAADVVADGRYLGEIAEGVVDIA